jgi:peptidylprolyl isomerase
MRPKIIAFCLLAAIGASAQKNKKTTYPDGLYAEVNTTKGLVVIQLEFERTPMTVMNFVGLSEGTLENKALPPGKPYYDSVRWHRVVSGHVIQCGIPNHTTAGDPGYKYPNEIAQGLNHGQAGMVGIANGGWHTNGSQWYITLADRSYLDGDYTIFGHVTTGMDVLPLITEKDYITTLRIVRVGKAASAFRPTTADFRALVERKKVEVKNLEEKRLADEQSFIQKNWPNAQPLLRQDVLRAGEGPVVRRGDTLRLQYKGQLPGGDSFISTADGGKPWYGTAPESFVYIVGTSALNPGFDAAVRAMRKGERDVVIVPSALAYGSEGFYPPERKGEKRFHVSPHRTIIYEVELLEIK